LRAGVERRPHGPNDDRLHDALRFDGFGEFRERLRSHVHARLVFAALQQIGIQYTSVTNAGFLTALYVPLVPLLNGGSPEIMSEQTTKEIVFLFDQTGVVKKYRVMQR
jgi:hypothetical protein